MIYVYTGPMFSEKSKALINTYNLLTNESQAKALCFKPSKDNRDKTKIRSRALKQQIDAIVIKTFEDILKYIKEDTKYIFIDEIQFITGNYNILMDLSIEKDIDFYIAGLSLTSEQKPFGEMPNILAIANEIITLYALCECGHEAAYSYCKENKTSDILIGDKEYKPVCRECLIKYRKGKTNERKGRI